MKSEEVTEFLSERTFDIYDAVVGYHILLLRSSSGLHGDSNIDLIFGGVYYVELPSTLFGVRLTKPCDDLAIELETKHLTYQCVSDNPKGEFVYAIESRGNRFHVVSSALWIHVNTLRHKSSLDFMCFSPIEKEDYYSHYLKEEYKIVNCA